MSHFCLLVITDNGDEATLAAALQPYHDFECTGVQDQYVVEVDETDSLRESYAQHSKGRTFEQFVKTWSSATLRDGRYYRQTNPNAKWDWWQVGGRYAGRLVDYYGNTKDSLKVELLNLVEMKELAVYKRNKTALQFMLKNGFARTEEAEQSILAAQRIHALWLTLPEPRPRGEDFVKWQESAGEDGRLAALITSNGWLVEVPELKEGQTLDQWAKSAPALSSFAVLKDGEWHERGQMGWFGCAANELPEDQWEARLEELLKGLRTDQWVTVVDCHI